MSEASVFARPHFRRQGDDLYFFLSDRVFRHLSPTESALWTRLESGPILLGEVKDRGALQSLTDAGLLEVIEPVRAKDRQRILVVEPHCDDAALSIGATMWKMRSDAEFHILTLASRSNYSTAFHLHRNYFDRSRITAMRTAEGQLFARHLGGHYSCADLSEATLRYRDSDWDLGFFNAHEVSTAISNNRRASAAVLEEWVARLKEFLKGRTFDEIWVPLGAGTHSDHDLARNASLQILVEEQPKALVRLYEDVPYGAEFQEHTDRILATLRKAGAKLVPWFQDVSSDFDAKLSLLGIFASQFKVRSIQPGVERSATPTTADAKIERLWTVERFPNVVPSDAMWIGAPEVANMSAQLQQFRKGASTERRVAIFAINPSGRWAEDLALLSGSFPAAKLVVYASTRVCAEFRDVEDPRVELRCLDGRSSSWVKAALREFATGHRIIIAGDALGKAKALALLWPTGRKLICSAMDQFIQAIAKPASGLPSS